MLPNTPSAAAQAAWSLDQWLSFLSDIHPQTIELGLDRVRGVFQRLGLDFKHKTIITVAGTNGKGTTCAMLEQALLLQQKTVAVYSSPHLTDYRERVRVQGQMLSHAQHCAGFAKIEQCRQGGLLTYFEFGTLQALWLMAESGCDYLILEVGLGGRLDAVNIVDPDIAVITSIDLDHQEWLGDTREAIAREKAGIFRPHIPAVIGEPEPPCSLYEATQSNTVQASWQGQQFSYSVKDGGFNWQNSQVSFKNLPLPHIPAQNASTALQVLTLLGFTPDSGFIATLFSHTRLPGRRQLIRQNPAIMLDVAHNPHATRLLATDIKQLNARRVMAVVGMLADKDIARSLEPMHKVVDCWYCATLAVPRGAEAKKIVSVLSEAKLVLEFDSIKAAFEAACHDAQEDDFIVVFGSFYTVSDVLKLVAEQ